MAESNVQACTVFDSSAIERLMACPSTTLELGQIFLVMGIWGASLSNLATVPLVGNGPLTDGNLVF
jgi:hypothetical protein